MAGRTDFDPASGTWRYVKAWAAGRLDAVRAELEAVTTGDDAARVLRGRIAELKNLDALDQPRPDVPGAGDSYS